jgi:hypothetical protein
MKTRNDTHILSGISELARSWRDDSRNDFTKMPLEEMFHCIERNFSPSRPNNLSRQNWRFTKQRIFDDANLSPEKVLEKKISRLTNQQWVNQVRAASGFYGSGGRKRSIDLVFESADSTFVFYELKVSPESGAAFNAAIELLGYGLLYIYSRTRLAATYKECRLMKARTVHLRVLGTWNYYSKQTSKRTAPSTQLEDAISLNLSRFASAHLPVCKMDFGFYTFPQEFVWSVDTRHDDRNILSAVAGIHPLPGLRG